MQIDTNYFINYLLYSYMLMFQLEVKLLVFLSPIEPYILMSDWHIFEEIYTFKQYDLFKSRLN